MKNRSLTMVSWRSSTGIWRAAGEAAQALIDSDVAVELGEGPDASGPNHFHLGNSTRRLVPAMVRHSGSVVTVHDAIPRNAWMRRIISAPQARLLNRLHVVTHSNFAADLLRDAGWNGEATVVPSLLPVTPIDQTKLDALRSAWEVDRFRLTIVSAGEVRASKGTEEIVHAAGRNPDIQVVLLGRITEPAMADVVARASNNVRHVEAPSDDDFCHAIAAADGLLSLRRDSVGETSGPVVQAHRLGRPVIGLASGTLPEACGPGDVLLDPRADAGDLFAAAASSGLAPLAAGSPQIPQPAEVAQRLIELYDRIGW